MISNLSIFKNVCKLILFSTSVLELVFFPSVINAYGVLVMIIGWLLVDYFVIKVNVLKMYPISSFMLIGFGLFNFLLPIPLTLLDFHPISFNLIIPLTTFTHLILYLTVLVFTHYIYRYITKGRNIFRNILRLTNFYAPLSTKFIWISAIIGTISMYLFWSSIWHTESVNKTFFQTIMGSLQTYAIIPAILLFPKLIRMKENNNKNKNLIFIIISGVLVAIIGVMSNFRTAMYLELMLIASLYFYSYLHGNYKLEVKPSKIIIIVIGVYIVFGPMMDIATSMVFLRGSRTQITSTELLHETIELAKNKELVNKLQRTYFSESTNYTINDWDEYYLTSPFLNRYCNLKINDGSLYHAARIGDANPKMRQAFWNVFYIITPRQLLSVFDVSIEKKIESKLSLTDTLYYLSNNQNVYSGGAKIGSMQGIGMSLFGYWYLLIIIPLFFLIFYMFDSFVDIRRGYIIYSLSILIGMINVLNYFNDRHVWAQELAFIFRNYWEGILLTCMYIYIIKTIIRLTQRMKI